jgi:hypothetical protein
MAEPRESLDEIFARARAADVVDVAEAAGVKLWRAGRRMRGECPLCHASKGKRADGAFSADPQAGMWKCWACGLGGDVVRLEHELHGRPGEGLADAARRLAGVAPGRWAPAAPRSANPVRKAAPPGRPSPGERMWREARPAAGSLARTYLAARGIGGPVLEAALRRLRFHPAALWDWDAERGQAVRAPAMLAQVTTPAGPTGGIHCTYLRADGGGKAALSPAKKMWGPQADADGRPGGAWLIGPGGSDPLVVAEGIETALSAAMLWDGPCRAAAALALNRLQGGYLVDRWGRADPAALQADPDRPAFTWPDMDQVAIAVDRDMSPIEIKVRGQLGGSARRRIEGEARARICAGLAAQHWRRAGARQVHCIAPAAGRDFNDQLREEQAA